MSIYKVPAQWGGLITGSSCRLTRPLTGCGVKIRTSAGERFQLSSSTAHTDGSHLTRVYRVLFSILMFSNNNINDGLTKKLEYKRLF